MLYRPRFPNSIVEIIIYFGKVKLSEKDHQLTSCDNFF